MSDPEKRIGQVEIEPVAKDVVFGQVVELVGDSHEDNSFDEALILISSAEERVWRESSEQGVPRVSNKNDHGTYQTKRISAAGGHRCSFGSRMISIETSSDDLPVSSTSRLMTTSMPERKHIALLSSRQET